MHLRDFRTLLESRKLSGAGQWWQWGPWRPDCSDLRRL